MTDVSHLLDPLTGLIMSNGDGKDNEILNMATLESIELGVPYPMLPSLMKFLYDTKIKPGLYLRYPGATDNSVDNYVALASLSIVLASEILEYGKSNFWCFDPSGKFSLKYFFGRFIGFRPYIIARAKGPLGPIDATLYALATIFTALSPPENTSDKCLQVLMNDRVRGVNLISDFGIRIFELIMDRKYPLKRQSLYAIYFGPDHPFTQNVGVRW